MSEKKIKKFIIPVLLVVIFVTSSYVVGTKLLINDNTFSFVNKEEKLVSNFDNQFDISANEENLDTDLNKSITELTKKTTYLLLGSPNMQNESTQNYYKRHKDYLALRYNPKVPEDEKSVSGLDENSQEFKDDVLSGLSVPSMFLELNELEVKYNSYGEIRITKLDNERVLSTVTLENVKIKEPSEEEPMKYNIVQKNLTMYYYFKLLNNEYKLLYLYGETDDDIRSYIENSDEKSGELTKDKDYNSKLRNIYDFSAADNLKEEILNKIYDNNKENVVYLNAIYNIGTIVSANGIFIGEGLIATTYNFVEQSLMKAQNILIMDGLQNVYQLDGIVTMNIQNDIAILKIKDKNSNYIKFEDTNKLQKENAVISLNNKNGVGLATTKGIVTSTSTNIQTSIPVTEEIQGSPVFNSEGKIIGLINSKSLNSSISYVTENNILKEYSNKLSQVKFEEIKAIPFSELKENYYIKYNEETQINNVPEDKLKEYSEESNIDDVIKLKLIKSSYKDGIISLRYKNDIKNYINTMQFALKYIENLKSKGYEEKYTSDSKVILEKDKNRIIISEEFDYLIIVMVRL